MEIPREIFYIFIMKIDSFEAILEIFRNLGEIWEKFRFRDGDRQNKNYHAQASVTLPDFLC